MEEKFTFLTKETFDNIVNEYIENNSTKGKEKLLINKNLYNNIKTVLLNSQLILHDSQFRSWCRSGFTLLKVGSDYIVCKKLNQKAKDTLEKEGKPTEELPVLVLEEMYRTIGLEHTKNLHCE